MRMTMRVRESSRRRRRGNLAPRPGTPAVASLMTDTEQADQLRKLAIIPAYNEEGMVGQVVRGIRRHAPEFDIVVVDDGSTDRTFAEASAEGVTVIRHPFNLDRRRDAVRVQVRGGQRVRRRRAGRRRRQHKPAYLNDLLEALRTSGRADMVCGSRFREDPGYKVPIGRRIGNLIFSLILSVMVRRRITDPTSGFRMTNRRGIELFARDYPHDYPEVEAILMLHAHSLRLHEVPVRMNARGFGRSSIDYPRSAYYMAKVLLALFVGLFLPTRTSAAGPPRGPARRPRRLNAAAARSRGRRPCGDERHAPDRRRGRAPAHRPDRRGRGDRGAAARGARAGQAPPARRALRAAVDDGRCRPARARRVDRPARLGVRSGGDRRSPNAFLAAFGVAFVLCCTSRLRTRGSARRQRSSPRRSRGSTSWCAHGTPREPTESPTAATPRTARRGTPAPATLRAAPGRPTSRRAAPSAAARRSRPAPDTARRARR